MEQRRTWQEVVQAARDEAKRERDWGRANAIERAQRYLRDPRIEWTWDEATHTLTIVSPQSGETYCTNGSCTRVDGTPCPAFADGRACWHMEAVALLRRLWGDPPPDGLAPLPVPVQPPPQPLNSGAAAEPQLEPTITIMWPPPPRWVPVSVPLCESGHVVGYAHDASEAEQWFARHEALFMGL